MIFETDVLENNMIEVDCFDKELANWITVSFGEYINRKGEMLLKEIIKIFKQIQDTSSTNDKKAIIAANNDN